MLLQHPLYSLSAIPAMKIELSHDLLAKKIHEKASQEDKMLLRIRKFIQDRFTYFNESKALLSLKDINYISPYLDKVSLEPHEQRFIRRSKDRIWIFAIALALVILGVWGTIVYLMNRTTKLEAQNSARMAAQIARYQEVSEHANQLSEALTASREGLDATEEELRLALLALQERNDTLVNSYATYIVKQDNTTDQLKNDLKIAQSARLSELSAPLVSLNNAYAFRLAAEAWNLNPDNQQAMRSLYRIVNLPSSEPLSKQQTRNIIKKYKGRWGSLSEKEMAAIFHPENKVTAEDDIAARVKTTIQITAPPPPTSPPFDIKREEMDRKIEEQRNQIQQRVEKINMQQQKMRNQLLKAPN